MKISKYNASGNDFIIFSSSNSCDRSALAKALCDRLNGIGADGLIVIIENTCFKNYENDIKPDFKWEFYNSDGSTAQMCGNGSRAAAMFSYENAISGVNMNFLTGAGIISAKINNSKATRADVEVTLTKPKTLKDLFEDCGLKWELCDTGVPHLVTFGNEFDIKIAQKMREKFDANVNFAHIENNIIFVRTFERGVEAETKACGTGMAASFFAALNSGFVKNEITAIPASGAKLNLRFDNKLIFFSGEVVHVFDATIQDEVLLNMLKDKI